jgi:hypothetical protein
VLVKELAAQSDDQPLRVRLAVKAAQREDFRV